MFALFHLVFSKISYGNSRIKPRMSEFFTSFYFPPASMWVWRSRHRKMKWSSRDSRGKTDTVIPVVKVFCKQWTLYIILFSHIIFIWYLFLLLLFSHLVVSDSLRPHGLQHTRLPCPSLYPGVCPNSCPLSWWCCPTIYSYKVVIHEEEFSSSFLWVLHSSIEKLK